MNTLPAIAELEKINRAGWPPLDAERVGGWELRFSRGYTRRANSANALPAAGSLERHLPAIEARFAGRRIPPVFRLTPLAPRGSDDTLAAAGYVMVDPSPVMLAPLRADRADHGCEAVPRMAREWLDGFARASDLANRDRAAHEAILAAIAGHANYVLRRDTEGRAVAFGLAVHVGPAIVISDVVVEPGDRRRGHGAAIVSTLMAAGARTGAAFALLNTRAENRAALALYAGLGFAEVYRYHYRARPG